MIERRLEVTSLQLFGECTEHLPIQDHHHQGLFHNSILFCQNPCLCTPIARAYSWGKEDWELVYSTACWARAWTWTWSDLQYALNLQKLYEDNSPRIDNFLPKKMFCLNKQVFFQQGKERFIKNIWLVLPMISIAELILPSILGFPHSKISYVWGQVTPSSEQIEK